MTVRFRGGSYPIIFTRLITAMGELPSRTRWITDSHVAHLYPTDSLPFPTHVVPAGEASKSFDVYQSVLHWLADTKTKRGDTVVAFGGGVIGDLAGFAAATYMRGVSLVQIPSTLLAMVDSSVGGKVGIDLPQGKNLVGAFKPPKAVYVCPELLQTLPEREWRSGLAEVLKYGFIMDAAAARELHQAPLMPNDDRMEAWIKRSIEHKAYVVERDEYETTGLRATLNFGHTVGHAIEKLQNYTDWLHGEAIAAGMVVETLIAEKLGLCPVGTRAWIESSIAAHGLPTRLPAGCDPKSLVETMALDKKAGADGLAFSFVTDIGTCKLFPSVNVDDVRRILEEWDES